MDYAEWNLRIADHFFTPQSKDKPVYLRVDPDELAQIAGTDDVAWAREDFCRAVRQAVGHDGSFDLFNRRYGSRTWLIPDQRMDNPPPFVALLAASVLAAYDMANDPGAGISVIAYYPRLQTILATNETPQAGRNELRDWWRLLSTWLSSLNYERGRATAHPGRYAIIGYPLSQCTLRREDRERLPDFFRWSRLGPSQLVDQEQLIQDFSEWVQLNRCTLTRRTVALLRRLFEQGDADSTLEDLIAEYERWDGTFREPGGARAGIIEVQAVVIRERRRLALRYVSRQPEGFPSGLFQVSQPDGTKSIDLSLARPGFYDPLDGLDVSGAALRSGLSAVQREFRLRLPGRQVYVLEQDLDFGDWVSRDLPSLGEPCMVLATSEISSTVERLLNSHAQQGWYEFSGMPSGLPDRWHGYSNVRFEQAFEAPSGLESLEPRRRFEVKMVGGLKFGPDCWMEGAEPTLTVHSEDSTPLVIQIDERSSFTKTPPFKIALRDSGLSLGEHRIQVGNRFIWLRISTQPPADSRYATVELDWKLDPKGGPILESFASPTARNTPHLRGAAFNSAGIRAVSRRQIAIYPGHALVAWIGRKPGQFAWLQERPLLDQLSESVLDMRPPQEFEAAWLWLEERRAYVIPTRHPALPVDESTVPKKQAPIRLHGLQGLGEALRQQHGMIKTVSPEIRAWAELVRRASLQRSCVGDCDCDRHWAAYRRIAEQLMQ